MKKHTVTLMLVAGVALGLITCLTLGLTTGAEAGNYDFEVMPAGGNEYLILRLNRQNGAVVGTQVDVDNDGEEFEWTGWRKFEPERGVEIRGNPRAKPMK